LIAELPSKRTQQSRNLYGLHQQKGHNNYEPMIGQNVHILAILIYDEYQKFLH